MILHLRQPADDNDAHDALHPAHADGHAATLNGVPPGRYAIKGGGVPIRVRGVEGVVGVVVVSGLSQMEDHGVIMDVIEENWERVG